MDALLHAGGFDYFSIGDLVHQVRASDSRGAGGGVMDNLQFGLEEDKENISPNINFKNKPIIKDNFRKSKANLPPKSSKHGAHAAFVNQLINQEMQLERNKRKSGKRSSRNAYVVSPEGLATPLQPRVGRVERLPQSILAWASSPDSGTSNGSASNQYPNPVSSGANVSKIHIHGSDSRGSESVPTLPSSSLVCASADVFKAMIEITRWGAR